MAATSAAQLPYLTATLNGTQEVPPNASPASGAGCFTIDTSANTVTYNIEYSGLTAAETSAHIHGFAGSGQEAGVLVALPAGSPKVGVWNYDESQESGILSGQTYVNIHTTAFPNGEIRGQILTAPPPVLFCPGVGCPCGNDATGLGGCMNSLGTSGLVMASGFASLSCDSLVLQGSAMPDGPGLYFQGTAQENGGAGTAFGDGLRCAGGTFKRLKTKNTTAGASSYPEAGDPPIHVQGVVFTPGARYYQVWYRNSTTFCTSDTFNLTNGVMVTWVP